LFLPEVKIASLQELLLLGSELFFIPRLFKTTSSREIPWYTKISAAGVTLVLKILHRFILAAGTIEILFQNSKCRCGKNVTEYKKVAKFFISR